MNLPRRSLFRFIGAGLAGAALPASSARSASPKSAGAQRWLDEQGFPLWSSVPYPLPLPGDGGSPADDATRFAHYTVQDTLVLPEGFEWSVVASYGEEFGPADDPTLRIRFGYNCDFLALIPLAQTPGEFWLCVNHEYISARPWREALEEDGHPGRPAFGLGPAGEGAPHGRLQLGDVEFPSSRYKHDTLDEAARARAAAEFAKLDRLSCEDQGVRVLHCRRAADGALQVIRDSHLHKSVTGCSARGIQAGPDGVFTGPSARLLPRDVTRTFCNCSGGVTPWGTLLSCEENIQDHLPEWVTPDGRSHGERLVFTAVGVDPRLPLPFEFTGLGHGDSLPADGRAFGWVVEIDPATGRMAKHTALGRFRHENVALRARPGERLAAYMGDDRRGGHVWKFLSEAAWPEPGNAGSFLLEKGVLHAARFDPDFRGAWIPLVPETPLVRPDPFAFANGVILLPSRPGGAYTRVGTGPGALPVAEWVRQMEEFGKKPFHELTLGDLVVGDSREARLAVILLDAHLMANAAGATPSARPEDVEVHPHDRSVHIAFTDTTGSDEGSPDTRVFWESAMHTSRRYGAILRLTEEGDDPAARRFLWGRLVEAGELAEAGGGFSACDNLAFDDDGHLWMVTDIATAAHNYAVDRGAEGSRPGDKNFQGIFGNNAVFCIPTSGPREGQPACFAIGPMECELTGPCFLPGGGLLLSVQHPGELHGTRAPASGALPPEETRELQIAGRDGRLIRQVRTVPLGSNFPSGTPGRAPRPCVVQIRKTPSS